MSNRLLTRLLAAFGLVILVVIAIVFVIANQTTNNEFRAYMYRGGMLPSSQFARDLATYYAARGSWQDVDGYFAQTSDTGMGNRGITRGMPMMGAPVLLADTSGVIVASRDGAGIGQRVSSAQLAQGIAIEVDGQAVGTVIFPAASPMFDQAQQEFLARVNVSILIAGIAAGVIAFILGFVLVFQITAPLDALARAAQKIARGDLTARVAKPSADEIGQVSRAFNAMADSLAQSETARRNMIADIAHELRNPLGVLRGQLEGMMDGVFPTTPDQLASLHEETLLLARLVEDLRELALADAGQLQKTDRVEN
ncbi:MAG: HAMP domain-containing protein [Chloroflexi bacterium]|nr:HAMP domain-containing protein [Chloroflexota bacterium]